MAVSAVQLQQDQRDIALQKLTLQRHTTTEVVVGGAVALAQGEESVVENALGQKKMVSERAKTPVKSNQEKFNIT